MVASGVGSSDSRCTLSVCHKIVADLEAASGLCESLLRAAEGLQHDEQAHGHSAYDNGQKGDGCDCLNQREATVVGRLSTHGAYPVLRLTICTVVLTRPSALATFSLMRWRPRSPSVGHVAENLV